MPSQTHNPGTVLNDGGVPVIGNIGWLNRNNAKTNDGAFAAAYNAFSADNTFWLLATNFGFTVPTDADIDGIEVLIDRGASGAYAVDDNAVKLFSSGSPVGNDAATGTFWKELPGTRVDTYGGASDLWGGAWTPADVNNSTFGIGLSATIYNFEGPEVPDVAYIDYFAITVHYALQALAPPATATWSATTPRLNYEVTTETPSATWTVTTPTLEKHVSTSPAAATWASTVPTVSHAAVTNPVEVTWASTTPDLTAIVNTSPAIATWTATQPSAGRWVTTSPSVATWTAVVPSLVRSTSTSPLLITWTVVAPVTRSPLAGTVQLSISMTTRLTMD